MYAAPKLLIAQVTKPVFGSERMNAATPSRSVPATSAAATTPGGSSAVTSVVRMPPTLSSLTATRPAAVRSMPDRMVRTCGGW